MASPVNPDNGTNFTISQIEEPVTLASATAKAAAVAQPTASPATAKTIVTIANPVGASITSYHGVDTAAAVSSVSAQLKPNEIGFTEEESKKYKESLITLSVSELTCLLTRPPTSVKDVEELEFLKQELDSRPPTTTTISGTTITVLPTIDE